MNKGRTRSFHKRTSRHEEPTFFMMGGMVSRFMPSAPRYIMRAMVPDAVRGRMKVGSTILFP